MSGLIETLKLGATLTNSGDYSTAILTYLDALRMDENNATAWFCLGVLYSKTGSSKDAVEAFEKCDEKYPDHPPTLANLAYLLEESEPERASNFAKRALPHLEQDEKLNNIASISKPEETQELVFIESQPINEDPADQILDMGISPDSVESSRQEEARALSSSGDHSTAVSIWKDLLEQTPDSPEVWRGLGEALSSAGYEDRAVQCMKRADQIESDTNEQSEPEISTGIHDDVDDDELLLIAADEVRSAPVVEERGSLDDSLGWYNMGINLLNEGKNDEALSSFEKAIGGCPSSEVELRVKAQNGRGNALYNEGRYPESIVAYHTAIGLDPKSVSGRTLFNMGSSYAAVEMFDDAIKCFSQSLERGLDESEAELCEKQISRCRVLAREQAKRQARGIR
ncbi:MAG: tetratricopeptide repeat protein [Candidatus Thalassarchaeum sp.]|nr:tetratricopeptide repeat protein [Candidatus Thalassarchaeum sp.]